jgi:hypothetical protein
MISNLNQVFFARITNMIDSIKENFYYIQMRAGITFARFAKFYHRSSLFNIKSNFCKIVQIKRFFHFIGETQTETDAPLDLKTLSCRLC